MTMSRFVFAPPGAISVGDRVTGGIDGLGAIEIGIAASRVKT